MLCVDWDLEAPGLARYLTQFGDSKEPVVETGVLELIEQVGQGGRPDWKSHVQRIKSKTESYSLFFMDAGRRDDSYEERLQAVD